MERREFVLKAVAGLVSLTVPKAGGAREREPREVHMVEIHANDPGAQNIRAYLYGRDVSDECNACYVPDKLGVEGLGWVDLILLSPDRRLVQCHDGSILCKRTAGMVKWEWWDKKSEDKDAHSLPDMQRNGPKVLLLDGAKSEAHFDTVSHL